MVVIHVQFSFFIAYLLVDAAGAQSLPDQSTTASGADDAQDMIMDFEESEQSPLGLTLRKSPSLVNMISKNLEGVDIDQ